MDASNVEHMAHARYSAVYRERVLLRLCVGEASELQRMYKGIYYQSLDRTRRPRNSISSIGLVRTNPRINLCMMEENMTFEAQHQHGGKDNWRMAMNMWYTRANKYESGDIRPVRDTPLTFAFNVLPLRCRPAHEHRNTVTKPIPPFNRFDKPTLLPCAYHQEMMNMLDVNNGIKTICLDVVLNRHTVFVFKTWQVFAIMNISRTKVEIDSTSGSIW